MTALLQRLRIWCAQRLLDLGLIEAAKRVAPEVERPFHSGFFLNSGGLASRRLSIPVACHGVAKSGPHEISASGCRDYAGSRPPRARCGPMAVSPSLARNLCLER